LAAQVKQMNAEKKIMTDYMQVRLRQQQQTRFVPSQNGYIKFHGFEDYRGSADRVYSEIWQVV